MRAKGKATATATTGKATKEKKPDWCLDPIRTLLKSQKDTSLSSIITVAATAMLSATSLLRAKRSGVLKLRTNDDLFPKSANIKNKLDIPKSLLKDATTIARSTKMDQFTQKYKTDMKQVIVEQAEVNAWHQEDERLNKFITHAKQIATACATTTRFDLFQETNQSIIPDDKLGVGSLWCYFKNLDENHIFFTEYLLITRIVLLERLWNEFTTADSKPFIKKDELDAI